MKNEPNQNKPSPIAAMAALFDLAAEKETDRTKSSPEMGGAAAGLGQAATRGD